MVDIAGMTARLTKMESAIKKVPNAKIINSLSSKGTIAEFQKAGKNIEVQYGNLVGIGRRVVKNADDDVLSIMETLPYESGGCKGFSKITKDAKGNLLSWVADFSSGDARYITNNKIYPRVMDVSKR